VRRAWCWLAGHRWRVLAESYRASLLGHLHTLAGCAAICERCGLEWDDLPDATERRHVMPTAKLKEPRRGV
jgi:hypothetical protein